MAAFAALRRPLTASQTEYRHRRRTESQLLPSYAIDPATARARHSRGAFTAAFPFERPATAQREGAGSTPRWALRWLQRRWPGREHDARCLAPLRPTMHCPSSHPRHLSLPRASRSANKARARWACLARRSPRTSRAARWMRALSPNRAACRRLPRSRATRQGRESRAAAQTAQRWLLNSFH